MKRQLSRELTAYTVQLSFVNFRGQRTTATLEFPAHNPITAIKQAVAYSCERTLAVGELYLAKASRRDDKSDTSKIWVRRVLPSVGGRTPKIGRASLKHLPL